MTQPPDPKPEPLSYATPPSNQQPVIAQMGLGCGLTFLAVLASGLVIGVAINYGASSLIAMLLGVLTFGILVAAAVFAWRRNVMSTNVFVVFLVLVILGGLALLLLTLCAAVVSR